MSHKVAKALGSKVGDMSRRRSASSPGGTTSPMPSGSRRWPAPSSGPSSSPTAPGRPCTPAAAATIAELGITQTLKVGTYATMPAGVTGSGQPLRRRPLRHQRQRGQLGQGQRRPYLHPHRSGHRGQVPRRSGFRAVSGQGRRPPAAQPSERAAAGGDRARSLRGQPRSRASASPSSP